MKKLIVIFAVLLTASMAQAANVSLQPAPVGGFTSSYTIMSGATTTGTVGTSYSFALSGNSDFGLVPISKHMCTARWTGTAPTNVVFYIECSESGTQYGTCASTTMTATPTILHIDKPGVRYIRANYVSREDGDATTALTITCTSGGL